jgi:hypothetical protein
MINSNGLEHIKVMAELEANLIPGGVIYIITDGDSIIWRKASESFDLDIFQIGDKLNSNSIAGRALKENIPTVLPSSLTISSAIVLNRIP